MNRPLRSSHLIKNQGFTLIEVMVVVVILGILAALIVPKIMSRPEQARLVKAKKRYSFYSRRLRFIQIR